MTNRAAWWSCRTRRGAALAGLAVCACAATLVCATGHASTETPLIPRDETKLARFAGEVREQARYCRFDEPDVPGERGQIVPITQALLDSDRVFRVDALLRTAEFGSSSFHPGAYDNDADLRVIAYHLRRLEIERDTLRCLETDPGRVWPRIDGTIRPLLAGKPGVLCKRLALVTRRLKEIPEALRAARVDLQHPSRLAVESAIRSFGRTLDLLRREIPAGVRDCREPGRVAALAEADTLAVRAIDEYVSWLGGDVLPVAEGTWAMGGKYARWLEAATGDSSGVAKLRARAERELAALPMAESNVPTLRADSLRAAAADSLLEARASHASRSGPSGLRTVLGRPELAWGWVPYAARVRTMPGRAPQGDPPRFAPSRLDLAATIAEIDLQTGAANFEDARARLERDAGIDSLAADREARIAALAPVRAAATVTAWQLDNLEGEVATGLGPKFSPRAFLGAVMGEGAVPVPAVRLSALRQLGLAR